MRWVVLLTLPCAAAPQPAFLDSFSGNSYTFGVTAMKVDTAGNTYLTGYSRDALIPVTADAFQPQPTAGSGGEGALVCTGPPLSGIPIGPCPNAFLMKLDPTGAIVYATYLGGSATTYGMALAIDPGGDVFVCGLTQAPGLPVTAGAAFPTSSANAVSAFVQKFDPSLQHLIYSTYIPGITSSVTMAIDAAGNAYLAGTSTCVEGQGCLIPYSGLFPATPGAFQTTPKNSSSAGVIAALNESGSALIYATYLSGSVSSAQQIGDEVNSLAVDASGDAYVAGFTAAADFPVTPGAFQTTLPNATSAAFAAKLNPQGSALLYSTFLGGSGGDYAQAIGVDLRGEAWVFGETVSTDFPLTAAPFESAPGEHFLAHLSADGGSLTYSTYFPGVLGAGEALDLDAGGEPIVASTVSVSGLPTGPAPFQGNLGGNPGVGIYIAQFTAAGKLVGATYINGQNVGPVAAAPGASVVVTGSTGTASFATMLLPWETRPGAISPKRRVRP